MAAETFWCFRWRLMHCFRRDSGVFSRDKAPCVCVCVCMHACVSVCVSVCVYACANVCLFLTRPINHGSDSSLISSLLISPVNSLESRVSTSGYECDKETNWISVWMCSIVGEGGSVDMMSEVSSDWVMMLQQIYLSDHLMAHVCSVLAGLRWVCSSAGL